MTRIIYGERIGKEGNLRLGCSVVIFDKTRSNILLTRRKDNELWCLPGGMIEAGETITEGCEREVLEETGLQVHVTHLTGIYSNPHHLVIYPDGNRAHIVVINFIAELLSGEPIITDETIGIEWFSIPQALEMNLFHSHTEHIRDAMARQEAAFIR
jgi:ADP-ribose pyrophosphatase YjhB (NUDIX family)